MTAVERDLVSWFKVDGDFPVILTVGFTPHSADGRATLVSSNPGANFMILKLRVKFLLAEILETKLDSFLHF